tara:strand:+ start:11 stop:298 length:288 start_codon:yes stop_codon:yes gene_type:complete
MNEEEQKEEKLVNMGLQAQELLKTEVFNGTVNAMVDGAFQAFCNSKSEETSVRERTYHHYRALVDIVSTLQQRVAIKDEIITNNDAKNRDNNEEG